MDDIIWGIIGCGNVTEVKSGPAFNKVPHSRLVAVMRRSGEKAQDYAKRHHVPRWYDDAHRLIADSEVNAIYIATPPSSHEEYALAAIAAGKNVYIEKPMSLNAASAQRIASAADQNNVKVCVAHYRRELALFRKIKELIGEHAVGNIRLVSIELMESFDVDKALSKEDNWRIHPTISGGGIFHDLAPHQLDLLLYFFGTPEKMQGISFNQGGYYDADDIVNGAGIFPGKILFNGVWCFNAPKKSDICRIIGSEGSLEFPVFTMDELFIRKGEQLDVLRFEVPPHVQQPLIAEVVRYFRGESANPCSAWDGVKVMQMIDDITSHEV